MLTAVLAWEATKDWLSATLHLTHWELHAVVGLALFLLFGRLLRRPLTSPAPLVPLAVLEAGNEVFDFTRYWLAGWPWEGRSTAIEVALTLVPPLLVILLARLVAWTRSAQPA